MKPAAALGIGLLALCACSTRICAQAEVSGWGNLRGIRVSGQLVSFTTAVGVFDPEFSTAVLSQREGPIRTSQYVRDGASVTVSENLQYPPFRPGARQTANADSRPATNPSNNSATNPATQPSTNPAARRNRRGSADGFSYRMTYTDSAPGTTNVTISLTSPIAQNIGGVFYFLTLPASEFAEGTAELIEGKSPERVPLGIARNQQHIIDQTCKGIRLAGRKHTMVEVDFPEPLKVVVRRNGDREDADIQVYFPIIEGNTTAGQSAQATFTVKAAGDIETSPVTVVIDSSTPGRAWEGIGGNYRIQNQRLDPLHIQYILDNMRVAYGRVALPWNVWQPQEDSPPPLLANPTTAPIPAPRGGGGPMNSTASAMEIAQKLAKKNIPMIISVWSPPSWAVLPNQGGGRGGGQRLDPTKYDKIARSLGSYLVYLRDHFGAEPVLFSFNESNVGINVKQSPQEHDAAIKVIGEYFKSIGLKTRMLLGDTGDAPPVDFIQIALNDQDAIPYLGAVSFHSWRGATDQQYQRWADAADQLGLPLIDAEGGGDAQASSYSNIFREEWYSLDEADEYVRIMQICQPLAILEWQFTENYSVLTSDKNGELVPTRRFFNLKQFNLAPASSRWLSAHSTSGLVHCAALADKEKGICTIHLVNNGAARPMTIVGVPDSVKQLHLFVTDADRGMKELPPVSVANGLVTFPLDKQSLTTLTTETAH